MPEEERRDPSQALIGFLSNPQKVRVGTGEEIHLPSGAQKTKKERKNVSNANHHVKGQGAVPEKAKNSQCIPCPSPECVGEKPKDTLGKAPQVHPAIWEGWRNVEQVHPARKPLRRALKGFAFPHQGDNAHLKGNTLGFSQLQEFFENKGCEGILSVSVADKKHVLFLHIFLWYAKRNSE
jgi:hypothetical protein